MMHLKLVNLFPLGAILGGPQMIAQSRPALSTNTYTSDIRIHIIIHTIISTHVCDWKTDHSALISDVDVHCSLWWSTIDIPFACDAAYPVTERWVLQCYFHRGEFFIMSTVDLNARKLNLQKYPPLQTIARAIGLSVQLWLDSPCFVQLTTLGERK